MSYSVHKHRESAPETVRVAILTISDTRTPETDTGGDIAGTAYGKKGNAYTTKGATGVPTRLLVEFLIGRSR